MEAGGAVRAAAAAVTLTTVVLVTTALPTVCPAAVAVLRVRTWAVAESH